MQEETLHKELKDARWRLETHEEREKKRRENGITSDYRRWLSTGETLD